MRSRLPLLDAEVGGMERGREVDIVVVVVRVSIVVALSPTPPLHDTAEALIVQVQSLSSYHRYRREEEHGEEKKQKRKKASPPLARCRLRTPACGVSDSSPRTELQVLARKGFSLCPVGCDVTRERERTKWGDATEQGGNKRGHERGYPKTEFCICRVVY